MFLSATSGSSIWNIQIPFSEEAKYWALGTSVFLFLIAICIMIWQILRYCTQLTGSRHTGMFHCKRHNFFVVGIVNTMKNDFLQSRQGLEI